MGDHDIATHLPNDMHSGQLLAPPNDSIGWRLDSTDQAEPLEMTGV
jgi:hypothetical protein